MKFISLLLFFMLSFSAWGLNTQIPMDEKNVTIEMIDADFDGAQVLDDLSIDNEFSNQENKITGYALMLEADIISYEIFSKGLNTSSTIETIRPGYPGLILNSPGCSLCPDREMATGLDQFDFG